MSFRFSPCRSCCGDTCVIFQDNFDDNSLDTDKWDVVNGTGVSETGGKLEMSNPGDTLVCKTAFTAPVSFYAVLYPGDYQNNFIHLVFEYYDNGLGDWNFKAFGTQRNYLGFMNVEDGTYSWIQDQYTAITSNDPIYVRLCITSTKITAYYGDSPTTMYGELSITWFGSSWSEFPGIQYGQEVDGVPATWTPTLALLGAPLSETPVAFDDVKAENVSAECECLTSLDCTDSCLNNDWPTQLMVVIPSGTPGSACPDDPGCCRGATYILDADDLRPWFLDAMCGWKIEDTCECTAWGGATVTVYAYLTIYQEFPTGFWKIALVVHRRTLYLGNSCSAAENWIKEWYVSDLEGGKLDCTAFDEEELVLDLTIQYCLNQCESSSDPVLVSSV